MSTPRSGDSRRRLWIVKVGSTVPIVSARRGDFEDWFRAGLGLDADQAPLVEPHRGAALPDPDLVAACVVTGSPAMVTDAAPWSLATERWLRTIVERDRAVLGVCYGHQQLARALGGRADWNPNGREIGSVAVELTAAAATDPLFSALPSPLLSQASHSQSVVELPPGAVLLARNEHDPHQSFRFGTRAWGVQFHPEFDADIIRGYLEERRATIAGEGHDVDAYAAETRDSDHGQRLLARFREMALA